MTATLTFAVPQTEERQDILIDRLVRVVGALDSLQRTLQRNTPEAQDYPDVATLLRAEDEHRQTLETVQRLYDETIARFKMLQQQTVMV